jgi:hypothetical protein
MSKQNLDQICAKYGYCIAEKVYEAIGKQAENHITKSLSVLREDGVYAFFLYQASRLVSLDHCLNWPYNCGRI